MTSEFDSLAVFFLCTHLKCHYDMCKYSDLAIKSVLGLKLGALTYRFGDQISNIYYLCIYFIYWLFCCFNVLILFTFNPFLLSFHAVLELYLSTV